MEVVVDEAVEPDEFVLLVADEVALVVALDVVLEAADEVVLVALEAAEQISDT